MTDQEAAFLREIQQHWDDPLPRLIYADWLEEQGDEFGELIRISEYLRSRWEPVLAFADPVAKDLWFRSKCPAHCFRIVGVGIINLRWIGRSVGIWTRNGISSVLCQQDWHLFQGEPETGLDVYEWSAGAWLSQSMIPASSSPAFS
jgi:uncharacterized protein (TIGR02996 family)